MPDFPSIIPIDDGRRVSRWLPSRRGPLFRLLDEWHFNVILPDKVLSYIIPQGYEFDKASVPSAFWGFPFYLTPDGLCVGAALEHDFLCDLGLIHSGKRDGHFLHQNFIFLPRAISHQAAADHFHRRLLEDGVAPSKAGRMHFAVKYFGPKFEASN